MKFSCIALLLMGANLIFAPLTFAAPESLTLATQPKGHTLSEESEIYVRCALERIKHPYSIIRGPWERAQRGTVDGTFDGFFIAAQNDKRDAYAVFSKPFYSIKWLYVVTKKSGISPDDEDFKTRKFSADRGSARIAWLENKHKNFEISKKIKAVDTPEQVMKMLLANRVDVALLNDHGLKKALSNLSLEENELQTYVVRDTPAGLYLSKKYLQNNPEFLDTLNQALSSCEALNP